MKLSNNERDEFWPPLSFAEWKETAATLHMWTQIVGKIRLTQTPWINHSWHVTLYVTSRGLSTSPIPHGLYTFEISFDFIDHELRIVKNDGASRVLKLRSQSVAKFYHEVMNALAALALPVTINTTPNEVQDAIPFERDVDRPRRSRRSQRRAGRSVAASRVSRAHGRGTGCVCVRRRGAGDHRKADPPPSACVRRQRRYEHGRSQHPVGPDQSRGKSGARAGGQDPCPRPRWRALRCFARPAGPR